MRVGRRRRSLHSACATACLTAILLYSGAGRGLAVTQTTVTTYQYNADGAATAVTTQVDDQPAATVYFTWDNFVPDSGDPSTGSVLAANGNLRGFGATPGGAYSTEFRYDQRDRLLGARSGTQAAAYAYYPASLMASSTLVSGDSLGFYYDAAPLSQVANIAQPSTATWSSYLGNITYLSDGTEQMRCQPRKDVAGLYAPAKESFSPNPYDPYGAPSSVSNGTASPAVFQAPKPSSPQTFSNYDMALNPFQFTGEYRDATSGAYYLRARWYLPGYQTFLQRDHGDRMHRYSYTGGNPIGNVDPSGHHGVEAGARAFLRDLHASGNGARGTLSRIFLGGIIGTAQIIANPSGYWHQMKHDTGGTDIFLAAGVLTEVGTTGWFGLPELPGGTLASFGARHLVDTTLGVGQSVASGLTGHRRFDWAAVGQGMEYTAGGIFWGREVAGIGYKPFGLTTYDLDDMAESHFQNPASAGRALVFRVRYKNLTEFTTPWMEQFHIGNYHEALLAVGQDGAWLGQVNIHTINGAETYTRDIDWNRDPNTIIQPSTFIGTGRSTRQLQFVGTISERAVKDTFITGLTDAGQGDRLREASGRGFTLMPEYNKFTNNCQQYSARMRATLLHYARNPIDDLNIND